VTKIDEEKGRYSVTLPVIVIDDDQSLDSMGWNLNSKAKHSIGSVHACMHIERSHNGNLCFRYDGKGIPVISGGRKKVDGHVPLSDRRTQPLFFVLKI
jgi:hypothetical protein